MTRTLSKPVVRFMTKPLITKIAVGQHGQHAKTDSTVAALVDFLIVNKYGKPLLLRLVTGYKILKQWYRQPSIYRWLPSLRGITFHCDRESFHALRPTACDLNKTFKHTSSSKRSCIRKKSRTLLSAFIDLY